MNKKYTKDQLIEAINIAGSIRGAGRLLDIPESTIRARLKKEGYNELKEDNIKSSDEIAVKDLLKMKAKFTDKMKTARSYLNAMVTYDNLKDDYLNAISQAVQGCVKFETKEFDNNLQFQVDGQPGTLEILFSDSQIGKILADYNSDVAYKRIAYYTDTIIKQINRYKILGYKIEKIILALLGDIIESSEKHKNSSRATDVSTPTQMEYAIKWIFNEVIQKLASFNIPMEVVCVTGNHDHDGEGMKMFKPGREHLSWTIYQVIQELCIAANLKHVTFKIPEGVFSYVTVYGQTILYEHGYGISPDESAIRKHVQKRGEQLKSFIQYFRMGDKHHVARFNNDRYVINGAFFGSDDQGIEYSGMMGYDAGPAQLIFMHIPRTDKRLSVYDSFLIQLGHII